MASNNFSIPTPPIFTGENYPIWAVKMKTYLRAFDLWEIVETGREPTPLSANPTVAQIKQHNEENAKKFKALSCIHSAVSDVIFTRIMTCETAKEAWNKLKEEFQGSERTKQIYLLNCRREFEVLRMKETETVKEYTDRLVKVVNQIRLLGEELTEKRIVEKVLVSLPERFEAKISSLEDSRDFSKLTLSELINALQALEQRRALRLEDTPESAFQAKINRKKPNNSGGRKQFDERKETEIEEFDNYNSGGKNEKYPPCPNCKKTNHSENFCWYRPDVKCRACNQLGHMEKVCKNKANQQSKQAQRVL
ncbi:hypothetical protein DH2020_004847 [Rehmannia glutinosa]|uniref:CCHC-type domain-containing protein n=1 Tax=Rehmannia glutinosa TaxID=99300 RepID=A0ABR0XQK1_REHGL